ncbi:alpha/beta fold hydrolase [Actinomadura adrarensis]|uniref:Alpha/beta fold hydrolase n=1 Tax=Actinomadura adrarensis TaxID=1819600 RepID=A0ABW3CM43_9ACTN
MKDLFWLDQGTGRPLILLHGGFLHHRMWDDQIPVFSTRYRVIAPDTRGHGRSAIPKGPYRFTDDLATLLRHLDTGPAVLVGVSMGAAIAVDTALEHPDLVTGVVISGAGTSEPYFTDPWTTQTMGQWHAAMAAGDLEGSIEAFTYFGLAGPHRTLDDVDPALVERLRRMTRETMSKYDRYEPEHPVPVTDTWERLAKISVPLLAINGALDSPDHLGMAERLAGTVQDGRAVSIEGAAHYPNMERPEEFNSLLDDFLNSITGQSAAS